MDWKIPYEETLQPRTENLLVGNSFRKVLDTEICVTTSYPRNTNHLNNIIKVRDKTKKNSNVKVMLVGYR